MHLRLYKEDVLTIAHYVGSIVSMLAVAMIIPFFVALYCAEWREAVDFLYGIGTALVAGSALRLLRIRPGFITSAQAIIVTGLSWMAVALVGAVPLYCSGHYASFLDATFEAVSAFTTTGLTLVRDIDHMANSLNMWRFLMQFIGGQAVLVAALSLGLFSAHSGSGMKSLYTAESRSRQILPSLKETVRFVGGITGIIVCLGTFALFVCLLVAGVDPIRGLLHAFWLATGAFDTGSFTPQSMSLMYYHSISLEVIITVLACLGCISFLLYASVLRGNVREIVRNIETKTFVTWIGVIFALCMVALASRSLFVSLPAMLRRGGFMIMSAATNSGFYNMYPGQMVTIMASGAVFAIILAMTVGGASESTSGGIKTIRIGLIVKSLVLNIKTILLPDSARVSDRYHNVTNKTLTPEVMSAALTITLLYIASYVIGGVVGIVLGYDSIPAMFESISAASNAGMTAGVATTQAPWVLKLVYIFQMWTGRLEFITIFSVLFATVSSLIHRKGRVHNV